MEGMKGREGFANGWTADGVLRWKSTEKVNIDCADLK